MITALIYTILLLSEFKVNAQEKGTPTTEQCVSTNDLEGLKYHLYSELAESKKEIDTLRADLNHWQNATLNILKKHFLQEETEDVDVAVPSASPSNINTQGINAMLRKILQHLNTYSFGNITEDITIQVREVMDSYGRARSQELREIISEMRSGRLPLGTFLNPVPSCKHLPDNSSSGNYWIQNAGTGYASLEYCDMTRRCCNSSGGWMRVVHLDMTDHTHHCPRGFRKISSPKRTCGRPGSGCYSTTYTVDGISYSRVCGRIKAYQYSTMDAFDPYYLNRAVTIDDVYVDGISLTHGQNPRIHIWTFANAADEGQSNQYCCPCTKTDTSFTGAVPPLNFIGEDYFCDTGSRYGVRSIFFSEDPLWDGAGCGGTSTCCQFNNPPWFCKQLPQPTTDDIELRLCANEAISNEEIAMETIELYVQ